MDETEERDIFFMRQAISEAEKAFSKGEVPIGAVVVSGGMIVGRGHNLTETLSDATAHAEMQALTAAAGTLGGKYLVDCILYVTVEPCIMCGGACHWTQVARVVYGAADPKRGYSTVTGRVLHPKTKVTQGVMADECGGLMKRFFEKLR